MTSPKPKARERELDSVLAQADAALARRQKERAGEAEAAPARVEEEAFRDIEANTFYGILFQEGLSPEAKKDALVEALTFALADDAEAAKQRLAEYAAFKGYLQFERKQLALEVIRLTDTGAFAELQKVLQDLNAGVVEFNDQMQPLTDIIDAVYELRMAGNTIDVFREIQEDKAAEAERARRLDEKDRELAELATLQRNLEKEIAAERERKSPLRFVGGQELTKAARMEIARLEVEGGEIRRRIENARLEVELVRAEGSPESRFAEFGKQKEKLRELLDLTTADHQQRQRALVNSAEGFVLSTSERVSSVLGHLQTMSSQADALYENNGHMRHAYAILSDAEREAGAANQTNRERLKGAPEGESSIQQMDRERRLEAIEDYVSLLDSAAVDTTQTLKDLTEQGGSIKTMRDGNRQQIDRTAKLHSSSVSGVSERLATVLQAVSAAALNEATGGAKASIEQMAASTRRILGQKAIENAVGMQETVDDLDKAIEQLREFGELQEKATGLTRQALSEIGAKMGELERVTEEAAGGLRRSIAVHAEAEIHKRGGEPEGSATAADDEPPPPRTTVRAPFKRLG
jgi:hypothetical protein